MTSSYRGGEPISKSSGSSSSTSASATVHQRTLVQLGLPDETSESQKRRTLAPSIGAILQAEDIGGWIRAEGISVPQGRSIGNLDMRKEKFDPVDDCEG